MNENGQDIGSCSDGGGSISTAREKWKSAYRKVIGLQKATAALRKVPLENKIGIKADELNDDDPLKVIALSVQRSLRDFGRSAVEAKKAKENKENEEHQRNITLEGELVSKGRLKYLPDGGEESKSNRYKVRQPQYECEQIQDDEFGRIRAAFGVTNREYYSALGLQDKRTLSDFYVISSKDASGKSSSFFFLTPDQRYILKLCTATDVETIDRVLTRYRAHIESSCRNEGMDGEKTRCNSLLPRAFGLYSLRFSDPSIPDVTLLAQANFFAAAYKIHKKFDLKGSTYGRFASEKERKKASPVFKDLDWVGQGRRLRFPSKNEMDDVRDQLQRDTAFLSSCDLIDYSLLVGIHEMDKSMLDCYERNSEPFSVVNTWSSRDYNICYFGIVDVLTPYNKEKSLETFFTGTLMCCRDVSCQAPDIYQWRFMKFCDDHILARDDGTDSSFAQFGHAIGSRSHFILQGASPRSEERQENASSSIVLDDKENIEHENRCDSVLTIAESDCSSCNSNSEFDHLLNSKHQTMTDIDLEIEVVLRSDRFPQILTDPAIKSLSNNDEIKIKD